MAPAKLTLKCACSGCALVFTLLLASRSSGRRAILHFSCYRSIASTGVIAEGDCVQRGKPAGVNDRRRRGHPLGARKSWGSLGKSMAGDLSYFNLYFNLNV
jgi:hypothetical protein